MKTRCWDKCSPCSVVRIDDSTTRRRDECGAFIELSVVLNAFHDKLWHICSAVTRVAGSHEMAQGVCVPSRVVNI